MISVIPLGEYVYGRLYVCLSVCLSVCMYVCMYMCVSMYVRFNERGLRVVFKDWSASYDDLLGRANMTSLFNNRLQDIAIFMYKIKHRMLPSTVVEILNTDFTR